jgi:hypothetical protein
MSTAEVPVKRHALGLPAGSIRATHTLLIVGLFCAMLLVPAKQLLPLPPYLIYLLFMVLGHYFAHRSGDADSSGRHPLYLPRGCVRFLVTVGLVATISWCVYSDPQKLEQQFDKSLDALKEEPYLPLCILGAFFLGVIVRAIVGRNYPPLFLQDMEAWLSLISIVGLCVAGVIHLIIVPSLDSTLGNPLFEAILASVIAFYFGERS